MRWTLGLAVSLGVASFHALAERTEPVRSLREIRQANVVVQQWDTSCGAAALATLLTYQHGLALPEKTIAEAMLQRTDPLKVKVRGGFSLLDLKRFADAQGLLGMGYMKLSLESLLQLAPAIVPVQFRGYPHFVVVRGRLGDKVLIADPAFGNRTVDVESFERSWQGNIGFVVQRRDGKAPPDVLKVQPVDMLRPPDAAVRSALR